MASVVDVAQHIIERLGGEVEPEKLHCLLYYCQAWHLVAHGTPLFPEQMQVWPAFGQQEP
ncbi:hypothetical protein Srot_0640 [Segniliparus rotundus DSM 44985]|uniref:Uncharacterized protein n=1 Tax=Segniliparus rotundus (strain ATCC BAA-972 / CDC 1076 / CIP 108378 / DSM 44985 / JCM 13578) TaxID=640132 RepID=D6ZCT0_SEGRD|nr:hypothetical protein [Segniliparus rotundus]ADG97122.1 hypothetical protein Srot_0640 [Segniliparus rotundus DSM 44985]